VGKYGVRTLTRGIRDETLQKVASPLGKKVGGQARSRSAEPAALNWEELGFICEGLSFAQRPIRAAARDITRRYNLGPRGAFILSLISNGVVYPLELASIFRVGRSLITAELTKLTDAGLIVATPGKDDRRRSQQALTSAGEAACEEVRAGMARIISRNLAGYSPDEVRLFARMLHDVRRLENEEEENDIC
jgi:DNA-binding MarR family transcriptional regulator